MTTTLAARLRVGLMAVAAFVRGNADATQRMNDALDALDEVERLEAEVARLNVYWGDALSKAGARILKAEAEVARLTAALAEARQ